MLVGASSQASSVAAFLSLVQYWYLILLAGRVDDAGDVARARQHVGHRAAEQPRADEHRLGRRDVVLLGAQLVDRQLDLAEIELDAADRHLPAGQLVLVVELAQVEVVVGGRHARRILVPEQQVERERLLAQHVVVDDVGPDQVLRPQHVEDGGHARAVEEAALRHHLFAAP